MEKWFMKKQAEEWIKFAEIDLESTKALINDEKLTTTAAFHVQQCIEKCLKALFELHNRKVPRIHDLIKLIEKLEEDNIKTNIKIDEEILDQINQVYIDTRYPSDFGLLPDGKPSMKIVNEFIEEAERIYNTICDVIEYNSKK
jgi:HEPN domain-containing protein